MNNCRSSVEEHKPRRAASVPMWLIATHMFVTQQTKSRPLFDILPVGLSESDTIRPLNVLRYVAQRRLRDIPPIPELSRHQHVPEYCTRSWIGVDIDTGSSGHIQHRVRQPSNSSTAARSRRHTPAHRPSIG